MERNQNKVIAKSWRKLNDKVVYRERIEKAE